MSSNQSKEESQSIFAAKKPQRLMSPRTLARKPNITNFIKKKPTQIDDVISSSRIRFISPGKANLFVPENTNNFQNSLAFNYTQYSSNDNINYPFIKRCASPTIQNSLHISRRKDICGKGVLDDSSFFSNLIEPSFKDFSDCSIISDISHNNKSQQLIQELNKRNSNLNLEIQLKNLHISQQKQQYDTKLCELTKELQQTKATVNISEKINKQTQEKVLIYQDRIKQLEKQLLQSNQKLDKAEKQIQMYKTKLAYHTKDKEQQENKFKKYHQNCCGSQEIISGKISKIQQNNFAKKNVLKDSKKINNCLVGSFNSPIKKIKSEKILAPQIGQIHLPPPPKILPCVMMIHQNEEHFNEYNKLKGRIQNLLREIRYKDIEILTLKKTRCEFEKQKQNYERVKVFNNKLLSRIQFLTKQSNGSGIQKRCSMPVNMSPKKKLVFGDEDLEKQDEGEESYETLQFELSPQRNVPQKHCMEEEMMFGRIRMGC